MITTSDGLQYEDALHVLLDNPIENARNRWIAYHREKGHSEDFIHAWVEAWDSAGPGHDGDVTRCLNAAYQATGYPYGAPTSASSAQA